MCPEVALGCVLRIFPCQPLSQSRSSGFFGRSLPLVGTTLHRASCQSRPKVALGCVLRLSSLSTTVLIKIFRFFWPVCCRAGATPHLLSCQSHPEVALGCVLRKSSPSTPVPIGIPQIFTLIIRASVIYDQPQRTYNAQTWFGNIPPTFSSTVLPMCVLFFLAYRYEFRPSIPVAMSLQ